MPSILFAIGFVITQRSLVYKKWENPAIKTLVINSIWLLLNILYPFILNLVFTNFVDNSLLLIIITTAITCALNLGVGILISCIFFEKDFIEQKFCNSRRYSQRHSMRKRRKNPSYFCGLRIILRGTIKKRGA